MNIKKGYNIPESLELKKSPIHGLGVFATEFIPKGTNLGICHYYDFREKPTKYLRNSFEILGQKKFQKKVSESVYGLHKKYLNNITVS